MKGVNNMWCPKCCYYVNGKKARIKHDKNCTVLLILSLKIREEVKK